MLKTLMIGIIKGYKRFVSPFLPKSCRYYPTCSDYAILAIEKYGVLKGSLKAVWRVLRCNPFSSGGIDYP